MDPIFRATAIYLFLVVIFRIAGRRAFSDMTTFDFVLLLVIGEATQQALLGDDFSITNACLVIVTLVAIDILFSLLKRAEPRIAQAVDGVPMIVVENGRPLRRRMEKARVDEQDVLVAARNLQGLERIEQIKFAVLEANGEITIIPRAIS